MQVLRVEVSGDLAWSAINYWGTGERDGQLYEGGQHGTHVWRDADPGPARDWRIAHEHLTQITVKGVENVRYHDAPPAPTLDAARPATRPAEGAAAINGFTHRYAQANGVRLHYVEGGPEGGPLVVLLHGFPETWRAWREVMPRLAAAGYRVVAPDHRGYGDSEKPAEGYDKATTADDVLGLVRHLGRERAAIVAHDVGVWTAYALAADHPEAVERLAVVEGRLPGIGLEELMDVAEGGSWHFGFQMLPDLPAVLIEGRERDYIAWFLRHNGRTPGAITEQEIDAYARTYAGPGAMRAALGHYRTLLTVDAPANRERAKTKLAMPVLAVGGGEFMADGPARDMRAVAADVRDAVLDGCGHFPAEERPGELANLLLEFFE